MGQKILNSDFIIFVSVGQCGGYPGRKGRRVEALPYHPDPGDRIV